MDSPLSNADGAFLMPGDTTLQLQRYLDGLAQGDSGDRRALLERAYQRLVHLTGKIMALSFPRLKDKHALESVVHEAWIRLAGALETVHPPTVKDFFQFAAHKIRHVLLTLAEQQDRRLGHEAVRPADSSSNAAALDPEAASEDPSRLAQWTEFHQRVEGLPAEERAVFEMHYYLDVPQARIAEILGAHPRQVSRWWIAATERLAAGILPDP